MFRLICSFAVIFVLSLIFVSGAVAQEKSFVQTNYLFAGLNTYSPNGESMEEVYGSFFFVKGGIGRWMSENFVIEASVGFASKEGDPKIFNEGFDDVSGSCKASLLKFDILAKYVFSGEKTRFYLGGGLTSIRLSEELKITAWYEGESYSESVSGSFNAIGVAVVLGIRFPVNEQKTTWIYLESAGSSANIKSDWGEEVDIGGGTLEAGVCFNIK